MCRFNSNRIAKAFELDLCSSCPDFLMHLSILLISSFLQHCKKYAYYLLLTVANIFTESAVLYNISYFNMTLILMRRTVLMVRQLSNSVSEKSKAGRKKVRDFFPPRPSFLHFKAFILRLSYYSLIVSMKNVEPMDSYQPISFQDDCVLKTQTEDGNCSRKILHLSGKLVLFWQSLKVTSLTAELNLMCIDFFIQKTPFHIFITGQILFPCKSQETLQTATYFQKMTIKHNVNSQYFDYYTIKCLSKQQVGPLFNTQEYLFIGKGVLLLYVCFPRL